MDTGSLDEALRRAVMLWDQLFSKAPTFDNTFFLAAFFWASLVSFIALIWGARMQSLCRRKDADLRKTAAELDETLSKYDREVQWRMAAEQYELRGKPTTPASS
jgi:hypothetical protein